MVKIKLIFAWYDLWIGIFWDKNKKHLYIFPIPIVGIKIFFGNKFIQDQWNKVNAGPNWRKCGFD